MQSVLWHVLVVLGLVVETVHLNLSARIKGLDRRSNHVDLLVHFYLLDGLVVVEVLLVLSKRVSDAD